MLNLQPLCFLAEMNVLLKVIDRQYLMWMYARDKPKVFCLALPSDVFHFRKPGGATPSSTNKRAIFLNRSSLTVG